MRVKVGNTWHECTSDQPIMIELTPEDRALITNMLPEASKYATFHDDSQMTHEEMREWMKS